MTVDEKVKEYLDRAFLLTGGSFLNGNTTINWKDFWTSNFSSDAKLFILEAAKMIQLEEHKQGVKKKRQRKPDELYFDYNKKEWFNLTEDIKTDLVSLYPQKDLQKEFKDLTGWLIKNAKSKRKNDFVKFVYGWFSR